MIFMHFFRSANSNVEIFSGEALYCFYPKNTNRECNQSSQCHHYRGTWPEFSPSSDKEPRAKLVLAGDQTRASVAGRGYSSKELASQISIWLFGTSTVPCKFKLFKLTAPYSSPPECAWNRSYAQSMFIAQYQDQKHVHMYCKTGVLCPRFRKKDIHIIISLR
jgi:hypothetical protein